jgi:peptidoglycan/LPS O-acetylase OafA/YrhL
MAVAARTLGRATAQAPAANEAAVRSFSPLYRPDIDGLRALAVTMVIVFHAFPRLLSGGLLGVDVFFVISGYLITQQILAGEHAGTFTVRDFYKRRVRRIVPALLVVLAACVLIGWYTLLPGEFRWLGKSMAWSTPFLANVFFAHYTGYFGPVAESSVLLHLWSLGIEEQFYILWPILLLIAVRLGVTTLALGALVAVSFAISLWGAWYAPVIHFYLPGARIWELALGGLLAIHLRADRQVDATSRGHLLATVSSIAGLALVGGGALLLSARNTFPGFWAVIPAAGTALLIGAGPAALVNRNALIRTPVVALGKRSYSLYLWHWPLLTFARIIFGRELSVVVLAILIALAVAAACATYRWVELPVRFGMGRARAVPLLLGGLVAFTVLGTTMDVRRFAPRLSGPGFTNWEAALGDWNYSGETYVDPRSGYQVLTARSQRAATALFIGDSHMQQYWPRVTWVIETHPETARAARFVAYAACIPLPGIESPRHDCAGVFTYASQLAFEPDVDTVVFGAFWEAYLLHEYATERRERVYSVDDPLHRALWLDSPAVHAALAQFERLVGQLVASGRRVFIVLSNPTSPAFNPPTRIPASVRLSVNVPQVLPVDRSLVDATPYQSFVTPVTDALRELAARTGARVLDPHTTLCESMSCAVVGPDGTPLYIDSSHLRASFARESASFLDETLLGH